jgi:isoquinoline 1-oxidoreductase beta subunit
LINLTDHHIVHDLGAALAIAHQQMRHVATRHAVPVGYWRSVGHSHNAFFSESFIDELAHLAGRDPLAFRLGLLADRPRHAAVLQRAAEQAQWGQALPPGRARGLALHESFDSIVAMVVEISTGQPMPRIDRVVCALDCGIALQPDVIAQQVEGSVVFGLSAALYGRIDIVQGQVQQKSFADQPLLRMGDCPVIETHIVPSEHPPTGMGEPAVPPVAPALANAWFALSGKRYRELPLRWVG